jgi:transcriptional regulator with GAF, ATPase, and Fis domain
LRVLQEQKFERVGGEQTIEVNVRVIAATNQNLNQKIKDGVFRSDLFFRLNVFPIHIPPLRERKNDIPLLVEHFRDKFNKKFKRNIEQIDEEVMRLLIEYDWPGNVRVLEGVIERAFVLAGNSNRLGSEHFHINLGSNQANENELESLLEPDVPLKESSKILEKMKIIKALERTNGSVTDAATLLGIDRAVVHRKMREHGIDRHIVLWGDI